MQYYSSIKRNTLESVLRWTNLEPSIQTEVSQKEKYKYRILIWNLERWYWWIYFQGHNWETDKENRLIDMGRGEEREGELNGTSNMETKNIICKIDSQWGFVIWLREPKQGLYNNLEGWNGKGDGREGGREGTCVYLWLILVDVWQKTTKFCKAIILLFKNKVAKK